MQDPVHCVCVHVNQNVICIVCTAQALAPNILYIIAYGAVLQNENLNHWNDPFATWFSIHSGNLMPFNSDEALNSARNLAVNVYALARFKVGLLFFRLIW